MENRGGLGKPEIPNGAAGGCGERSSRGKRRTEQQGDAANGAAGGSGERSSMGKRRTEQQGEAENGGKGGTDLNFTYCVIVYVPEVAPDLGVAKVGEEMHVVLHLLDVF